MVIGWRVARHHDRGIGFIDTYSTVSELHELELIELGRAGVYFRLR